MRKARLPRSLDVYGKLKSGPVAGGLSGKTIDSACSGDRRARKERAGRGRIGRSGYMEEEVSGEERSGEERFHS